MQRQLIYMRSSFAVNRVMSYGDPHLIDLRASLSNYICEDGRLVVLMIEVEQPEGVSTRKLVLETARHNLITAYTQKTG
jgi:hypothetical protein